MVLRIPVDNYHSIDGTYFHFRVKVHALNVNDVFLRNVGNRIPDYTASHLSNLHS
jgi:hypothetical protein